MLRTYLILIFLFGLFFLGCVSQQYPQSIQSQVNETANSTQSQIESYGKGAVEKISLKEWNSPDGTITLQIPEGWKANAVQVDTCTINWEATDPKGTSSAYMNNQILIFKSEEVKQLYKSYGLTGIDNSPVNGYLGAEQATKQIVAPLSEAIDLQVIYKDTEISKEFSQLVCIYGLVACDAQVFEASYKWKGISMRGRYFVQVYDFGDGATWWINIWGYTSPSSDWNAMGPILENVFASVKPKEEFSSKCSKTSSVASSEINEVIKRRQDSQDKAADAWDSYIKGS